MNMIFGQRFSSLVRLAALTLGTGMTIAGSALSAVAETDINSSEASNTVVANAVTQTPTPSKTMEGGAISSIPVPGTTATSTAALQPEATVTPQSSKTTAPEVAQLDVDPGQPTRGGSSYVGVAGNLGLSDDGDTAVGDGNFMIISKIGLTNRLSARPSVVLGDNATFLIPVTYDFTLRSADAFTEPLPIAPYLGGGVAISTGDSSDIGLLITGGVDVPLTPQLTATAGVNAAFADGSDVGLLIGVGYNFSGFGF